MRTLPNSEFEYAVAKILVNPRCVTTYAGVSHTQLALDLFGPGDEEEQEEVEGSRYKLDEWRTAPDSFVCQEMRTTGGAFLSFLALFCCLRSHRIVSDHTSLPAGRTAAKQQRRTGFQQSRLLLQGWRPT